MSKNIYLFYGENDFNAKLKVQTWSKQFLEKYGEESLENYDLKENKDFDFRSFQTDLQALPFFCEKKLVILENFFVGSSKEQIQKMAEIVEKVPDFVLLVFLEISKSPDKRSALFKRIKKFGVVEEFKNFSIPETVNWVLKFSDQEKIGLQYKEANFLVNYCGTELNKLKNELTKLKTYSLDKGQKIQSVTTDEQNKTSKISEEDIRNLCSPTLSSSIFEFTDCLANKNHKKSLEILEKLIQSGEDPIMIFFMIVRQFRILIQVKELEKDGYNQNSITKTLKQHPFVIKKSSSQCRNFTSEDLKLIYQKLLKTDEAIKTGKTKNYQLAISKLITEI